MGDADVQRALRKLARTLRDTENNVAIDVRIAGAFPGPATSGIEIEGVRFLTLPKLIELKLASGISAPHRLKDLADVQEIIKATKLPREVGDKIDTILSWAASGGSTRGLRPLVALPRPR